MGHNNLILDPLPPSEFRVHVRYENKGSYLLSSEDGSVDIHASGSITQEEGEAAGTWSLRLVGVVQDAIVSANVAVVGDQVHIFTKASSH